MRLLHVLLFAVVILLSACKKTAPRIYHPMNTTFKSYFAAGGAGSQYVYIDSLHNEYDTVTCAHVFKYTQPYTSYSSENYRFTYTCSRTYTYRTELETYSEKDSNETDRWQYQYNFWDSDYSKYFFTTYMAGKGFIYDSMRVLHFDSLRVGGKMYRDVIDLRRGEKHYRRIVIARDIGVVYMAASGPSFPDSLHEYYLVSHILTPLQALAP